MAADVTIIRTPAEQAIAASFAAARERLAGGPAARARREEAFATFAANGLPHRRVEEWRYTDLRAMLREAPPLAPPPATIPPVADIGAPEAIVVQFVDGHLAASASAIGEPVPGLAIRSLEGALTGGDPLLDRIGLLPSIGGNAAVALNSAFLAEGVIIHVAAGAAIERPVHLAFAATAAEAFSSFVRVLVVAEAGAKLTLVESHSGPDTLGHQPNTMVEIAAADDAEVAHVRLDMNGARATALSTLSASLGARTSLTSFNMAGGSALSRHQLFVRFAGDGARATLAGAAMLRGRQHADTTLVVDHAAPHGQSRELFKHVLDHESRGVFQGKIIVAPHAQKVDGRMMSQAVLLADGPEMDNKPELEIFADDVQCAHGATCGELDEDLLFYLKARGIPPKQAESLLIQAFVGEAIELVAHEGVREALVARVEHWLDERAQEEARAS